MDETLNQKTMLMDEESGWSKEIYEEMYLSDKDADLKEDNKQQTNTQESDASHKLNSTRLYVTQGMIRALQQLLNCLLPVYRLHPLSPTYRTQAVGLVQVEDSVSSSKEYEGDLSQFDRHYCRENMIERTLARFTVFSTAATEGDKDRSRPEPPPPRAFKLAAKVNINPANPKKNVEREGYQIPEESHHSSHLVRAPPIKKPIQNFSTVEPAPPSAAQNLSCDKPLDEVKNSTTSIYSYLDYRNPPAAVLYTRCEDEANDLVQSLER